MEFTNQVHSSRMGSRTGLQFASGDPLSHKDKDRLKVKGWEMILQPNDIQRKVGIAILTSEKADFKIKRGNKRKMNILNDKGEILS